MASHPLSRPTKTANSSLRLPRQTSDSLHWRNTLTHSSSNSVPLASAPNPPLKRHELIGLLKWANVTRDYYQSRSNIMPLTPDVGGEWTPSTSRTSLKEIRRKERLRRLSGHRLDTRDLPPTSHRSRLGYWHGWPVKRTY